MALNKIMKMTNLSLVGFLFYLLIVMGKASIFFCGVNITYTVRKDIRLIRCYGESCMCFFELLYPVTKPPVVFNVDHRECKWKCSLEFCEPESIVTTSTERPPTTEKPWTLEPTSEHTTNDEPTNEPTMNPASEIGRTMVFVIWGVIGTFVSVGLLGYVIYHHKRNHSYTPIPASDSPTTIPMVVFNPTPSPSPNTPESQPVSPSTPERGGDQEDSFSKLDEEPVAKRTRSQVKKALFK